MNRERPKRARPLPAWMAWLAVLVLGFAQPASALSMAMPMAMPMSGPMSGPIPADASQICSHQPADAKGADQAPATPAKPDCLNCIGCMAVATVAVAANLPLEHRVAYWAWIVPPPAATLVHKPGSQAPPRPPGQAPPIS